MNFWKQSNLILQSKEEVHSCLILHAGMALPTSWMAICMLYLCGQQARIPTPEFKSMMTYHLYWLLLS